MIFEEKPSGPIMFILPQGNRALGINILAQSRLTQGRFDIVGCQGIARQEPVDIPLLYQGDQSQAGIPVKDRGRPQNPQDKTVLPFMA